MLLPQQVLVALVVSQGDESENRPGHEEGVAQVEDEGWAGTGPAGAGLLPRVVLPLVQV